MFEGLFSGILWALDTVILGIALAMSPFVSTEQAIFLAPFASTFVHDFCSGILMMIYMGIKKEWGKVIKALKTKSGKYIMLGALLGGPIGMSGYVAAIKFIGPSYTAIISSIFPAIGALLAYIFLKEKMSKIQLAGLGVSILGVIGLSYVSNGGARPENLVVGLLCAVLCVFGWAGEAVICAYGMKDPDVSDEQALQIRQITSAIFYGAVILPIVAGWGFTISIIPTTIAPVILLAALFGTISYVLYYRAINKLGPAKAMALNITYTAWSIVFALILLKEIPTIRSIIFGVIVIVGSFIAANGIGGLGNKEEA